MFYNHPDVAQAYLNLHPLPQMAQPLASSRPTYWTYHEVWRLLTQLLSPKMLRQRLQILVNGKDAIFEWDDPLPFFNGASLADSAITAGKFSARQ